MTNRFMFAIIFLNSMCLIGAKEKPKQWSPPQSTFWQRFWNGEMPVAIKYNSWVLSTGAILEECEKGKHSYTLQLSDKRQSTANHTVEEARNIYLKPTGENIKFETIDPNCLECTTRGKRNRTFYKVTEDTIAHATGKLNKEHVIVLGFIAVGVTLAACYGKDIVNSLGSVLK